MQEENHKITPKESSFSKSSISSDRRPLANISARMQSQAKEQAGCLPAPENDDGDFFQPEFGRPSPLRNPLASQNPMYNPVRGPLRKPQSLFNDRHKVSREAPRPTFQAARDVAAADMSTSSQTFYLPGQQSTQSQGADAALLRLQADMKQQPRTTFSIEVPRNPPTSTTYAPPRPMFNSVSTSSATQKYPVKPMQSSTQAPDDEEDDDEFDPDVAVRVESRNFGSVDPNMYLDSEQANQNIKGLLEGAFDDETDKSKVRLRKRAKKQAEVETKSLADKLSSLSVSNKDGDTPEKHIDEDEDGTVEGMSIRLLPHQVEGVSWMIEKESGKRKNGILPRGGILADDMGLGKTVQSVALILLNPRPALDAVKEYPKQKLPGKNVSRCTLVVAPLALIKQWEGEIASKVSKSHALKVLVHHGANRTKSAEKLKKYDVVITTYQILTSEHAASDLEHADGSKIGCFGVHWWRIMLDEAHSIKNRNAKSTIACCALSSWNRWCLTGTPMQNNLDELQSLIKFLRIKPYCDLASWKDQITQPMKAGRGGLAMARLHHYLNAFMKRRTKDILKKEGALNFGGVSKDGEKQEGMRIVKREVITVECEFDEQEQQFYDRLSDRAQQRLENMFGQGKNDYIGALVLLLRLRQACNHPALIDAAIEKDRDAMDLGSSTPARSAKDDGMDDLAAMMGGVSMQTHDCDVCQFRLSTEQIRAGKTRCEICEQNISNMTASSKQAKKSIDKPKAQVNRPRRRVIESDDEEEDEQEEEEHDECSPQTPDQSEDDASDEDSVPVTPALARLQPFSGSKKVPSTKIRHILSILHAESAKHKTIIFSQFTSMLDIIQPHIQQRYVRYDGSMRPDQREAALNSLRTDSKTRVLLCSLKCGSLGLNLTAASRVIIVEPFWNPFVEEQAIDRVHRLNQTIDVKVFRLTVVNSVEEKILALQERKRELAAAAIEGGKAVGKLSMADILDLFKGNNVHSAAMTEADRDFAEKFGNDSRLIDGPGGKSMANDQTNGMKERAKMRAAESQLYGRRW